MCDKIKEVLSKSSSKMSSDLQRLANQYMIAVESDEALLDEITLSLVENKFTFLQLIQYLGKYLTEDSDTIRSKAIVFISEVLQKLPVNKLSLKECYFLMEFFINRLDDEFKNSISGVESLIKMNNFKSTDLIEPLLTKIETLYEPRQLLAKNRYVVFKILSELLTKFPTYLSSINDLYIKTFIKVSTGEKDPRNLLISFELNYKISTQFKVSQFAEDLFDNSFCYFPISFKPPPNDPYKISSEELKLALRKVLGCNSKFAKDCIPNLIEKLSSTSSLVKLDALNTLIECIENYSPQTVKEYSISIWNSLKYEVLHNELQNVQSYDDLINNYINSNIDEDHILPVTLTLFQKLFIKLTHPVNDDSSAEDYMTTDIILDELLRNLEPLDNKLAKQSALILSSLASTSIPNFNLVIGKTLPMLLSNKGISIPLQRSLIVYLSFFFDSYKTISESFPSDENLLIFQYKDEIMVQLSQSLMSSSKSEVSLRCIAINNLTKLANLSKFLETQELNLIIQYLTEILLTDDNPTTSKTALKSLVSISAKYPELVLELTIPKLLSLLPDSDVNEEISDIKTINSKEKVIEILSLIVENKQLLDVIMIRLLNKIAILSSNDSSAQYMKLIFSTMIEILNKTKTKMSDDNLTLRLDDYLNRFIPQMLYTVLSSKSISDNDVLLEISSKLIKLIIVNTESTNHQQLVESAFNIFIHGNCDDDKLLSKPINNQIKLLEEPSKLIVLFVKILSAVDKSTTNLPMDFEVYLDKVIEVCELDSLLKNNYVRLGYLQNLSLTVNKFMNSNSKYLERKFNDLIKAADLETTTLQFYKQLEVLTWVTKALILKDDPLAMTYENFIIGLLATNDSTLMSIASKSIEVLIADCDLFKVYYKTIIVFGKEKKVASNIDIRLLYKQKFFNFIIPKLVESFNDNESQTLKKNYLISLSLVLKYVDDSILSSHIDQVFPLVSKSLFFNVDSNASVIKSSLNIILMSLSHNSKLISDNLKTIIPRLLELINTTSDDEIKLTCLRCLIEICNNVDINDLIDYKQGIIRNLGYALDDRKRVIRKLAADCRQIYYDLGQVKD